MTQQSRQLPTGSYYDVLEVSPKASIEVVRAAYKSLMQRHHPDKSADPVESARRAPLIAQAYAVLSDADLRKAYDKSCIQIDLQSAQRAAPSPAQLSPRSHRRAVSPGGGPSIYAWLLMLFIIVGGGTAVWLTSKEKVPKAPANSPRADTTGTTSEASKNNNPPAGFVIDRPGIAAAEDSQSRTVPDLLSSLSVDLMPGGSGAPRVLRVGQVGVRVDVPDAGRWVQKIENQRATLVRIVLGKLATAQYEELIKPEGDLYLKQLIANAVVEAIGLDAAMAASSVPVASASAASTSGAARLLPPPLVEVLLPQSFSVR